MSNPKRSSNLKVLIERHPQGEPHPWFWCSAPARRWPITTMAVNGIGMGIAATFGADLLEHGHLRCCSKIIPDKVRIPCYIVVIAGFVTVVQMLVQGLSARSRMTRSASILPLIVVNCIILGRAEMFANKNTVARLRAGRHRHGHWLYAGPARAWAPSARSSAPAPGFGHADPCPASAEQPDHRILPRLPAASSSSAC